MELEDETEEEEEDEEDEEEAYRKPLPVNLKPRKLFNPVCPGV